MIYINKMKIERDLLVYLKKVCPNKEKRWNKSNVATLTDFLEMSYVHTKRSEVTDFATKNQEIYNSLDFNGYFKPIIFLK